MKFVSTRGAGEAVPISAAIEQGLAGDGGLYVPQAWLRLDANQAGDTLAATAAYALAPFADGDAMAAQLEAIAADAFTFPTPLTRVTDTLSQLELFHGPTAAFKDYGARFLAAALQRIRAHAPRALKVLVATSGDTGGAVAAAFHNRPGVEVAVLYPKGLVSPLQERQLTCWGGNVHTFEVEGAFDDCQRLVKQAFAHDGLRARFDLTSANSINLGRLLPQMAYVAHVSAAAWRASGEKLSFVVPSGNLGHATACAWARQVGFPVGDIVLAHNANRTMPDFLETGQWRARPSIATLASAMDVGDPSNAERLRHLFPNIEDLRGAFTAYVVDDDATRARMRSGFEQHGLIWCPHTAVAAEAFARHAAAGKAKGRWAIAATAHPAKFREIVEPTLGVNVEAPPALAELMSRPITKTTIAPDLAALAGALLA